MLSRFRVFFAPCNNPNTGRFLPIHQGDKGHMAEFGIDQHRSRAPIWECLYHAGSGVRLTIQPYNRVVVDMHPVFAQEDTVS